MSKIKKFDPIQAAEEVALETMAQSEADKATDALIRVLMQHFMGGRVSVGIGLLALKGCFLNIVGQCAMGENAFDLKVRMGILAMGTDVADELHRTCATMRDEVGERGQAAIDEWQAHAREFNSHSDKLQQGIIKES